LPRSPIPQVDLLVSLVFRPKSYSFPPEADSSVQNPAVRRTSFSTLSVCRLIYFFPSLTPLFSFTFLDTSEDFPLLHPLFLPFLARRHLPSLIGVVAPAAFFLPSFTIPIFSVQGPPPLPGLNRFLFCFRFFGLLFIPLF